MNNKKIRLKNIALHSFTCFLLYRATTVQAAEPIPALPAPPAPPVPAMQTAPAHPAAPAVAPLAIASAAPAIAPAPAAPAATPAPAPAPAPVAAATPRPVAPAAPPLRQILNDSGSGLAAAVLLPGPNSGKAASAVLAPAAEEPRHALVIGNSKYKTSPLTNPGNDARAMAEALEKLGFNVIKLEDMSLEQIQKAVREFGERLKTGGVGMFYYAGHGVQIKGNNYLVPTSADISSEDEVQSRAYNVNEILEKMESARNRLNLVVLDACRNNPFARSFRSSNNGLAQMDAPSGTLVAFSTAPGKVASDGSGKNGLYTEHLLRALQQPGLRVEDVFKQVRVGVMQDTSNAQTPWENTSLTGDFYFHQAMAKAAAAQSGPTATTVTLASNTEPVVSGRSLQILLPIQMFHGYQPLVKVQAPATRTMHLLPERKQILLVSTDGTVRSLDMETGATRVTIGDLTQTRIDPTFQRVAGVISNGKSDLIRIAETATGKVIATIPLDETRSVRELAFSPSGKTLIANIAGKELLAIDAQSGEVLDAPRFGTGAPSFVISPDSNYLLAWGNADTNIHVHALKENQPGSGLERIATFKKHWKPLTHVRFSPNGSVVSRGADNVVFAWKPEDTSKLQQIELERNEQLADMAFSVDGNQLLVRNAARGLASFDLATAQRRNDFQPALDAETFSVGSDGKTLFVTTPNKRLNGVDMATGGVKYSLADSRVKSMAPGGKTFLAEENGKVTLRSTQDGAIVADLAGQNAVYPGGGEQFFSTAEDGQIKVWNFHSGELVESFRARQNGPIMHMVASADAQNLLTYDKDDTLKVWEFSSVERAGELKRDKFETSNEYTRRLRNWHVPFSGVVTLTDYDADSETYKAVFGSYVFPVKTPREAARSFAKDARAILKATLQYYDKEQIVLTDTSLSKLTTH